MYTEEEAIAKELSTSMDARPIGAIHQQLNNNANLMRDCMGLNSHLERIIDTVQGPRPDDPNKKAMPEDPNSLLQGMRLVNESWEEEIARLRRSIETLQELL